MLIVLFSQSFNLNFVLIMHYINHFKWKLTWILCSLISHLTVNTSLFVYKSSQSIIRKEIMAACPKIHIKQKTALWWQNVEILNVKFLIVNSYYLPNYISFTPVEKVFYIYCSVHRNILWNNQQMRQCAVKFISLQVHSTCFGRHTRPSSGVQF